MRYLFLSTGIASLYRHCIFIQALHLYTGIASLYALQLSTGTAKELGKLTSTLQVLGLDLVNIQPER
jgi:hypothetical protein